MRYNSGKTIRIWLLLILMFILGSCKKQDSVRVTVLPEKENAELHFRGFVTDEKEELVSEIYNFSKMVTRKDTIDDKPVYVYLANSEEFYFYTDNDDGTVWERSITDIGARLVAYGFSYHAPIKVTKWEILLKKNKGVGTEWESSIDTTFDATTFDGDKQSVRYMKHGKARYDGWSQTFVPELYENIDALDVYWYDLKTFIINETTADTLFATKGIAHQYFLPEVGSIKYITNFTKYEKDKPAEKLRGTWELMRKDIPE